MDHTRVRDDRETHDDAGGAPSRLPLRTVVAERYLLVAVLGAGGTGTVYRALDQRTRREVALKVLHASLHGHARALQRFERESQALAELSHPHLAPTLDAGVDAATGARFHVCPLLEGETLRRIIEREAPLAIPDALRLVLPVLSALEAAHAAGIIHRDVKPENVVVTRAGEGLHPWLLDFGVCKRVASTEAITEADSLVGTPAYMAPEQARADEALDARVDVWAVGALLFELLTGSPPFLDAVPGRLLMRLLTEDAPRVASLRPDLPAALATAVDRALSRDRALRQGSAAQLREDLEAACTTAPRDVASTAPRARASARRASARVAVVALLALSALAAIGHLTRTFARAPTTAHPAPARPPLAVATQELDASVPLAAPPRADASTAPATSSGDRVAHPSRRPPRRAPSLLPYELE